MTTALQQRQLVPCSVMPGKAGSGVGGQGRSRVAVEAAAAEILDGPRQTEAGPGGAEQGTRGCGDVRANGAKAVQQVIGSGNAVSVS